MTADRDLDALERAAYRGSYADGVIDLYVGASLAWIGAAWIWLPGLAALAGMIPAVFVTVMMAARKQLVESRSGYVKWGVSRRRWERRNLIVVLTAGIGLFLMAIAAFVMASRPSGSGDVLGGLEPALLAWLLALLAIGLAFLLGAWRMLAYGGLLALGGAFAAWAAANPGWPLLGTGIPITVIGAAMLVRYLRRNPAVGAR